MFQLDSQVNVMWDTAGDWTNKEFPVIDGLLIPDGIDDRRLIPRNVNTRYSRETIGRTNVDRSTPAKGLFFA